MQEVDKREFAEVWGAAWAMYGKSVSPQLLSIAFEALRAYSIGRGANRSDSAYSITGYWAIFSEASRRHQAYRRQLGLKSHGCLEQS